VFYLFRAAASACVGEVAGIEIATFIEHLEDLPDLGTGLTPRIRHY
jgi:hypothetical protein